MHTYMHTCIHSNIRTNLHTYIHTHIQTYSEPYITEYGLSHIHAYIVIHPQHMYSWRVISSSFLSDFPPHTLQAVKTRQNITLRMICTWIRKEITPTLFFLFCPGKSGYDARRNEKLRAASNGICHGVSLCVCACECCLFNFDLRAAPTEWVAGIEFTVYEFL